MNSFERTYEDFTWVTLHLLQSSWEADNMKLHIRQYLKLEEAVKEALGNYKTLIEVYRRTTRSVKENEVALNDGDGSIRFIPYQKTLVNQLKMDAKILIKDIEERTQEGLEDDALEAYARGTIKSWKEHSGMAMLNQMLEERGHPIELFP